MIYRLLVPLPVAVAWPSGEQQVRTIAESKCTLEIAGPGDFKNALEFRSAAHAAHTLANGFKVRTPSIWDTFFARLVRDGRAEVVWGAHCEIYWLDRSITRDLPEVDARHTFESHIRRTLGDDGLGAQIPPTLPL